VGGRGGRTQDGNGVYGFGHVIEHILVRCLGSWKGRRFGRRHIPWKKAISKPKVCSVKPLVLSHSLFTRHFLCYLWFAVSHWLEL
jgi:hypothetical protein